MKIAFLGLGEMGQRMAKRLIEAEYDVVVWNRTPLKKLNDIFPKVAQTAQNAVVGADVVFCMVRDDAASQAVWTGEHGALNAMKQGALVIECSTCSVSHIRWLNDRAKDAGKAFIAAPLAGSTPQAETGKLIFFIGGAESYQKRLKPIFATMGQSFHYFENPSQAAVLKLWVNGIFAAQISIFSELLSLAQSLGLELDRLTETFRQTPVCSLGLSMASQGMLASQFKAGFPIELVEKDLRIIQDEAQNSGLELAQLNQVLQQYKKALEEGRGKLHITGVVLNHLPELA